MKWLVIVALCGCWPGLKRTEPTYRNPNVDEFAEQLAQASKARDVARVRGMLGKSVTVGGLWFSDLTCMRQFSFPGEVTGPKLDELARCLAALELKKSARGDKLPDVVVLTYGNGIELEARFVETSVGPWLAWIGYSARRDLQDALPTIGGDTLEALRLEGDPQAPLAGPGTFNDLEAKFGAYAWLKVCIDATGAVTGAHVREASSPRAARAFSAATQTWKFKPYTLGSQPAPVCSMVAMTYPVKKLKREMLPLPAPSSDVKAINVPSPALGERVSGSSFVAPDDEDKYRVLQAGVMKLVSAFHFCIDERGSVSRIVMLRTSGLPKYDQKIMTTIGSWRYKPFLDEGQPVPVCSSVHFIYSYRDSPVRVQR
jgi:hypothetical protein